MDPETKDLLEAGAAAAAILTCVAGGVVFAVKHFKSRPSRAASSPAIGAAKQEKFIYPEMGEAGQNLLHPRVQQVVKGAHVALSAVVPEKEELMVIFSGAAGSPSVQNLGTGDWYYTGMPAPLNWRGQRYEPGNATVGPSQSFKAQGGKAELDMHFDRLGEVKVAVYENGASVPSWTKVFHVVPPG
ncbi:hypothetical protein [Stenotrophomonas bentonitica]